MYFILKKKNEFENVFSKKNIFYSKLFKYFILKKTETFKCGIVISKKKGISVKRNKFKRQIKNILYQFIHDNNIHFHIILIPFKIHDIHFSFLKTDIKNIILKHAFIE